MTANPIDSGPIWPKFELRQDFMHVYETSNFKKDWISNNREKVETLAANSVVSSMIELRTHTSCNACSCYMKVSKGTEKKSKHHFPQYMGVFLRHSRAANSLVGGKIWPKLELFHNIKHVLVTIKSEKDRTNINGDYVMTSIFLTFNGS